MPASTAAACLLATIAIAGCASGTHPTLDDPNISSSTPGHGSLTDREFNDAVAVARAEAVKGGGTIASATATIGDGTETDPNDGPPCTSGKLIHIKLIGTFSKITHGGYGGPPPTPSYQPVSAVLITADAVSGKACLISVRVGPETPDSGATLLFANSPPASSSAPS